MLHFLSCILIPAFPGMTKWLSLGNTNASANDAPRQGIIVRWCANAVCANAGTESQDKMQENTALNRAVWCDHRSKHKQGGLEGSASDPV
jgi:hypothetical protein